MAASLCIACAGCGREPAAVAPASSAAATTPAAIEKALVAAEEYRNRRDLSSAEVILVKLIEKAPDSYRAHELYGGVLYLQGIEVGQEGDTTRAAALCERAYEHYQAAVSLAVEQDPMVAAGLHQSAGEIASVAGLTEAALRHFRDAGRLDPSSAKAALYEGQMLIQLERSAEARKALDRVLDLDPDEAFAYASLASVSLAEGDREDALRQIEEARRIEPANLAIRVAEARIRRRCDQPRRALELLLALDAKVRAQPRVAAEIAACRGALEEIEGSGFGVRGSGKTRDGGVPPP